MNRQQRLALKYKQQLRCEACAKLTPVEWDMWYAWGKAIEDKDIPNPIFMCDRYKCKRSRAEGLIGPEWRDRVWTQRSGKWTANVEEDDSNKPARRGRKPQKPQTRRPDKRKDVQDKRLRK